MEGKNAWALIKAEELGISYEEALKMIKAEDSETEREIRESVVEFIDGS